MQPTADPKLVNTLVLAVNPAQPEPEAIAAGADVLRAGGLVAFPTETVYGLGGRVTDAQAVGRVFEVKGRGTAHALIVHVAGIQQAREFVELTPQAEQLAQAFWPGPLSLVLRRTARVPDAVAAGGSTVAVRVPNHPVALALIEALGDGIAAPSANRSSLLPPTRAAHVLKGFDGRIEMVLDAGACPGGLESTVVDVSAGRVRVLRRGAVTLERLRELIDVEDASQPSAGPRGVQRGWLRVAPGDQLDETLAGWLAMHSGTVGAVVRHPNAVKPRHRVEVRVLADAAAQFASELYDTLHELVVGDGAVVWLVGWRGGGVWDAVRDRVERMARG